MIHHLVLMRLKPGISRDNPDMLNALSQLIALREQVDGIVHWAHGWDFVGKPVSYDFALVAGFVSRTAFEAYGPHPAHVAVATQLRAFADWVLCDFEA